MNYFGRIPSDDTSSSDSTNEAQLKPEQDAFSFPLAKYLRQKYLPFAWFASKKNSTPTFQFHYHIFRYHAKLDADKDKLVYAVGEILTVIYFIFYHLIFPSFRECHLEPQLYNVIVSYRYVIVTKAGREELKCPNGSHACGIFDNVAPIWGIIGELYEYVHVNKITVLAAADLLTTFTIFSI